MSLAGLFRQFSRYLVAVRWLSGRVYNLSKLQLLMILLGQWCGLSIIAVSILMLLTLVRHLENGQPLEIMAFSLPLADGHFLLEMVALVLLTMTLGVMFLYRARSGAVKLAAHFNLACAAEVASGYGVFGSTSAAYLSESHLRAEIVRLMNNDARHAGMALRRLIDAKLATLVLLVGAAVLFYLHWMATLAVLLAAFFVLPFYYRTNRKAALATRRYEAMSSLGRGDCIRGVDQQKELSSWQASRFPTNADGYPAFQAVVEAHRDRFLAVTQSELISRLLMVLVLLALGLGLGYFTGMGEVPWLLVLAYLLVLRFVMLAIRQVNQAFTSISRFYPSLYRLSQYFSARDAVPLPNVIESLAVVGGKASLLEKRRKQPLKQGRPTLLYLPYRLSRFNIELLGGALGLKTPGQQRALFDASALVISGEESSTFISKAFFPEEDKRRLSELTALSPEQLGITLGSDQSIAEQAGGPAHSECVARVLLAEALLTGRPLVLVDLDSPGMERAFSAMRMHFRERYVLICSHRKSAVSFWSDKSISAVMACNGTVVALGSVAWVQENWKAISAQRARIGKRLLAARAAKGLEELFEEE